MIDIHDHEQFESKNQIKLEKVNIIIMNLILIIKIDDEHKLFVRHEIYYQKIKFVFKRM